MKVSNWLIVKSKMTDGLGLVLITDRKICKGSFIDTVKLAIKGGVNTVQLREKELPSGELFSLASKIKDITKELNAHLIINDRPDIMLAVGAEGVHIGKKSMPICEVRKIIGNDKLIGYSAHNLDEAVHAEAEGADYISISPIYPTSPKGNNVILKPLGTEIIDKLKSIVNCSIIALGGINENNICEVLKCGVNGVAVVSNILRAPDPLLAAKKLSEKLKKVLF